MSAMGCRLTKRGNGEERAIGEVVRLHDKAKSLEERVQKLEFEAKAGEGRLKALEGEAEKAKSEKEETLQKLKKSENDLWCLMDLQAQEIAKAKEEAILEFKASPEHLQLLDEARWGAIDVFKESSEYSDAMTYQRQKVVYPFLKKAILELKARLPLETEVPSLSKGYAFLAYKRTLDKFLQGVPDVGEEEEGKEEDDEGEEGDEGGEGEEGGGEEAGTTTPTGEPAPFDDAGKPSTQPGWGLHDGNSDMPSSV